MLQLFSSVCVMVWFAFAQTNKTGVCSKFYKKHNTNNSYDNSNGYYRVPTHVHSLPVVTREPDALTPLPAAYG